ncbi:cellulose-binding protein [Streptomyces sp. NPDC047024]|uniref:cellulose-binding protein n=1 Tax=Streptomyces sp. NPDC047024 TaxID=3155476 RepID=UPI0033F06286
MSSASATPYGFKAARGHGYRPGQVDACLAALSRDRDEAWERVARLTVLARDMAAESARLRERAARLEPQTYDSLGEPARTVFRLVREEAVRLRERARDEARERVAAAEEYARGVRRTAREAAEALCAEAAETARQRLLAAHTEAEALRVGTRHEVRELRRTALDGLRETRHRADALLAAQPGEHAARRSAAEHELTERAATLEANTAERQVRAEAALAAAKRALAAEKVRAPRIQELADARAAEVLAAALDHEERTARETERVLREHGEIWDEVRQQVDHLRDRLSASMAAARS